MNIGLMLSEQIKCVEVEKFHFHKGTGDGCKLPSQKHIPTSFLGLLMVIILLLGAPTALAQTAYVKGEVIIGFQLSANENQIVAFETRYGLTKIKSFPNIRAIHYRVAAGQATEEAIAILNKEPIVEYAEPNWLLKRQALPTDPKFPEQWYLSNIGQVVNGLSGTPGMDINWLAANALFTGSQDIVVAVVDSGVAFDHPEILYNLWWNPHEPYEGVDNDGNGYIDDLLGWDFYDNDIDPLDENSHGTLVASLIAASSGNGEGGVGVSPRVKLMPLRVGNDMGNVSTTAVLSAFTYAGKKGANIINASFGGPNYSSAQYSIIQWLRDRGVLLVAAAGNGGNDHIGDNNDIAPMYPASYQLDNIISVAAIDQEGQLSPFSNFGSSRVHIAAPGTNIFGASPTFSTVFYESFDNGGAGWIQGPLPGSYSPYSWSLYTDGYGRHWITDSITAWGAPTSYSSYTNSYARTPLISVGVAQLLSYRIWYQLEYLYDWLFVEASSDGGASWTLIDFITGYSYSSCPSCSIYAGTIRNVDLSSYGLHNKNIYIRFRLYSDAGNNYDGVYLDQIRIKQVVPFSYDGTQYQYMNGTSFSAPLVTGVAALIWSQRPDFTYKQVRDVIINSAKSLPALQGKILTGGMVDAHASLQSANALPWGLTLNAQELYFTGTPVGVSSPIQSITLANAGTSIINISHFPLSPDSDFGGTHYCPAALSPGQTCYLELQMSPTSTGERDGYVQVVSDAPGSPHVIRLLGLGTTAAPPPSLFSDVPLDHWAYNYIMGIYTAGITTGCSQNPLMYCPDNSVTREQMAVFIIRSLNQVPTDGYCGGISPFTDIGFDRWSCKYIKRLAELGVTTGYGDGRFGPEDSVTREQMAVFLTKALVAVPPDGYCGATNPFTDVTYDRWSCKYIKKFAELGITSGYGDGRYGPSDYVNRAQMAVFLARAFLGM